MEKLTVNFNDKAVITADYVKEFIAYSQNVSEDVIRKQGIQIRVDETTEELSYFNNIVMIEGALDKITVTDATEHSTVFTGYSAQECQRLILDDGKAAAVLVLSKTAE